MSFMAAKDRSSQAWVELLRRGAAACREASALRACTQRLEDRFESLGLSPLVQGRRFPVAELPSLDALTFLDPLAPDGPTLAPDRRRALSSEEPPPALLSAEAYRKLFQILPKPCLCSDRRGIVRDVNESALHFFNVTMWRLVGKPLIHFVARGDTRSFRELVRGIEAMPNAFQLAVRFRPRGGRPAPRLVRVLRLGSGSFGWLLEEPSSALG
jgi:PAS domain-containing protein